MALRVALMTACMTLASHITYGELLVSEDFDYEIGDLDGLDGGTGFADEWIVDSFFTFEVDAFFICADGPRNVGPTYQKGNERHGSQD